MNELDPNKYQWFVIPGFRSYDINVYTREIRSSKHYDKDPLHIMKVYGGKVYLTDDYGKRQYVSVEKLYITTFNMGNILEPRANSWYSKNNMCRVNRNYNLQLNFNQFLPKIDSSKNHRLLKPFDIIQDKGEYIK